MKYDTDKHRRRSIRLKGYDYTLPGAYFVTICAQHMTCMFGEVVNGEMRLNDCENMVKAVWDEMPTHYEGVGIDAFVVMPNHVHGIIMLNMGVGVGPCANPGVARHEDGQPQGVATTFSLPNAVHRFKSLTTTRYRYGVKELGWKPFNRRLWQRNYYERIIRNESELNRVRQYIIDNPANWLENVAYPENLESNLLNTDKEIEK